MFGSWITEGNVVVVALWGTIVNAAAIVAGGLLGLLLHRMKDGVRNTVMQGIGMALVALGLSMALKSTNFLLITGSLVVGGIAGELLRVDKGLDYLGKQLERAVEAVMMRSSKHRPGEGAKQGSIGAGFVNATLVYCVGAMAILGSLDSGLRGDHVVLYTKSLLDGFLSVIFASTMGIGVLFSSLPVFLYQGAIALASAWIAMLIDKTMLNEIIVQLTAVGGILIMGIGINLLEIRKINVANLLPSLAVAAIAVPLMEQMAKWWAGP